MKSNVNMPLKKYNTTSVLVNEHCCENLPVASSSVSGISDVVVVNVDNATTTRKSNINPKSPSLLIEEKQKIVSTINNKTRIDEDEPCGNNQTAASDSSTTSSSSISNKFGKELTLESTMPAEIRVRLYAIFSQIEKEFDLLYKENAYLKDQLYFNEKNGLTDSGHFDEIERKNRNSSTSTITATTITATTTNKNKAVNFMNNHENFDSDNNKNSSPKSLANFFSHNTNNETPHHFQFDNNDTKSLNNAKTTSRMNSQLVPSKSAVTAALNSTSQSAKTALLSSKNRINTISFPKFKPNAREFIIQSIKNTSAQITNKTQSSLHNPKLDASLVGHKDGIWDVNCIAIPSHLLSSSTGSSSNLNSTNLLIGTASADTTARLWYYNVQGAGAALSQSTGSSHQAAISNSAKPQATSFCVQEYCGHTGSVNSIRFHPRFFLDATNLILTASGDCQAHIWQCVLSPLNDSFESKSEVVLNYNNCYSIATSNFMQTQSQNSTSNPTSMLNSPPPQPQPPLTNVTMSNLNQNYLDMITNPSVIRSPIKRYQGHSDACIAAEWFPDGELIATASWDRTANVYNVETGKNLCNLQHDDYLTNVTIHKSHKIILTSSKDTTFKIWDFRDPICSVQIYQGHTRSVNSAIFIGDDKIATSSDDHHLKLWDLRVMRSPVFSINVNSGINRICSMSVNSCAESPHHAETFICLPLDNRDIKIYNLQGERVIRLPRDNRAGHRRIVTSVASYDSLLFSASFDKYVNCWSLDYNPPKSSTSTFSTKAMNKENSDFLNESQLNTSPIANNSRISEKPPTNQMPDTAENVSPKLISPISPLSHITNNTGNKSINTLSKLTERIKI